MGNLKIFALLWVVIYVNPDSPGQGGPSWGSGKQKQPTQSSLFPQKNDTDKQIWKEEGKSPPAVGSGPNSKLDQTALSHTG